MSKNILLTGASSGIGLEIAKRLTLEGFQVWGTSRDISRLPKMENFHPLSLDLNSKDSIKNAWLQFISEAKTLDVLINNAGNGFYSPLEYFPQDELEKQFQTMVFGPIQLMQHSFSALRETSGMVINISSLASQLPIPFCAPYNGAKAALASISATLRLEQSKIRIIDLQPGDINTPFHDSMKKGGFSTIYEPFYSKAYKAIEKNMHGAPHPEIVAEEVLQLCINPQNGVRFVGDFFQSSLATIAKRILPHSVLEFILKKFYQWI